jgi:hypothetical protein
MFDEYQVDLVVCGHDHDYERSFPVRGFDRDVGTDAATGTPVETLRPHPVTTTDSGTFDTSRGTVHLILGGGGTNANLDEYGVDAKGGLRQRDPATGYGIAVFDVDPGHPGGHTSITVTYYHALNADPTNPDTGATGAPNPNYTEFETFTLVRPRSDGHHGH